MVVRREVESLLSGLQPDASPLCHRTIFNFWWLTVEIESTPFGFQPNARPLRHGAIIRNLDNKKPLRAYLPRGFTNLVLNNKARTHSTESSSKAKVVYANVHFYIFLIFLIRF